MIGQVIDAVHASTFPVVNTIVVADSCTDTTADIARTKGVTVVETNHQDKALAQNAVLDLIDTDVIVGFDGDTIPQPDCIQRLMDHIAEGYDATCATVLPIQPHGFWVQSRRFAYALGRRWWRICQANVGRIQVLTGAAYAFRTDAVKAVGGFPTGKIISSDMPMTWIFHEHGYKCGYAGDAIALTEDPETFLAYRAQMRRWASGYWQTMTGWRHVWMKDWRGWLVVGGAIFDLVSLLILQLFIIWHALHGQWVAGSLLIVWGVIRLITVCLAASVIGWKNALLGVVPYTIVSFYNKWLYAIAGIREVILGKRYAAWTGRHGRATIIEPMSRRRCVVMGCLACFGIGSLVLWKFTGIS